MHVVYERCAAIDVGKDEIAVAVRMPGDGPDGRVTVKRAPVRLRQVDSGPKAPTVSG